MIERLSSLKDSMLLFARNFDVSFTNNSAEQTVRNLKSKVKVAGNFRSDDGTEWYLKIRSYIDSARKHGINAFEAVKLAFSGTPVLCFGF
ncbi:MAG: transposase [Treponema sp.]|nr:transposase [Treponema sp.]